MESFIAPTIIVPGSEPRFHTKLKLSTTLPAGNSAFILPLLAVHKDESIFRLTGILLLTVITTVSAALHGPLTAAIT